MAINLLKTYIICNLLIASNITLCCSLLTVKFNWAFMEKKKGLFEIDCFYYTMYYGDGTWLISLISSFDFGCVCYLLLAIRREGIIPWSLCYCTVWIFAIQTSCWCSSSKVSFLFFALSHFYPPPSPYPPFPPFVNCKLPVRGRKMGV